MIVRLALAAAVVAAAATTVVAQSDPIAARKAVMKATGQQTAIGAKMVKGEEPFDLTKAKTIFATYQDSAAKMPGLFPDTAKSGGESTASPKIWESNADFKARFAKFSEDAKAAEASVKDLDSFKATFGNVTKNCGGCHEIYRIKKS